MKKINFKKISIKNFLSVGNVPVTIDFKSGLHIITGINKDKEDRRNGVGKSTIADGIYFAVFGETLRDLKKEFIINNINKKTCEVILDVEVVTTASVEQVQIVRTLDPSKCFIYVNGEDKTRDSIRNTNTFIMEKFDCTPEIFQNCVIMTLNNTVPFMAKKKQEKRKFIEDIFNLSIFGLMLTEAKNELNEKKKTFDILSAKFDEMSNNLISLEKQKCKFVEERARKQEKYLNRKQNNEKEITSIQKRIETFSTKKIDDLEQNIADYNSKIEKADRKINELREDITTNVTLISELEKKIKNVGTDADLCPMCLRSIEDKDKKHIKFEKNKIQEQIDNFLNDNKTLRSEEAKFKSAKAHIFEKIETNKSRVREVELQNQEKDSLTTRLKQLSQWQLELDVDLKEIDTNFTNFDSIINENAEKQNNTKLQIDEMKNNLNKLIL